VPVATVLAMTPHKPLFGQRAGATAKTHWLVFMKPTAGHEFHTEQEMRHEAVSTQ